MYTKSKTILGHDANDQGYKQHGQKIKYFINIANSIIFGGHLKIMQKEH